MLAHGHTRLFSVYFIFYILTWTQPDPDDFLLLFCLFVCLYSLFHSIVRLTILRVVCVRTCANNSNAKSSELKVI